MTGTTREEALRVLREITILRASSSRFSVFIRTPDSYRPPDDIVLFGLEEIFINGMAKPSTVLACMCDCCGMDLAGVEVVVGKTLAYVNILDGSRQNRFAATCVECFALDLQGFYSAAVASLVMET